MATLPPQADPSQADPADGAEDNGASGYVIEIKIDGKGAISVCVEPGSEEDAEESGAGGSGESGEMSEYQSVSSIREAVKLVMEIYNSQGEMPDASQDQADMSAGYGKD